MFKRGDKVILITDHIDIGRVDKKLINKVFVINRVRQNVLGQWIAETEGGHWWFHRLRKVNKPIIII